MPDEIVNQPAAAPAAASDQVGLRVSLIPADEAERLDPRRGFRRFLTIVIIFVVAAVLTPPDAFSQILLAIPMLILYEICVWLSTWIKR